MQGRLSPPGARPQSFPWPNWSAEFTRAHRCGLDCIEWLYESRRHEENPIWTDEGIGRIKQLSKETGVQVFTLCADYFIEHPFYRVSESDRDRSIDLLEALVQRSAYAGIATILLPVLEASELRGDGEREILLQALRRPLALARRVGVRLALESDLRAHDLRDLLERAADPHLGVYYDIGNAAAQGYDVVADLQTLRHVLVGVHVKDRLHHGRSVALGTGDADLAACFRTLTSGGYTGPYILEAKSGADYLRRARRNVALVRSFLDQASSVTS